MFEDGDILKRAQRRPALLFERLAVHTGALRRDACGVAWDEVASRHRVFEADPTAAMCRVVGSRDLADEAFSREARALCDPVVVGP